MTNYFPYESTPTPADSIISNEHLLPSEQQVRMLESVAYFHDAMPTGVTVSHKGRISVNFPKWGDNVTFTVAEIIAGEDRAVALYPDEKINQTDPDDQSAFVVSVQSVVVDPADRLGFLILAVHYSSLQNMVNQTICNEGKILLDDR